MKLILDIPEKWFDDMVREEFTEVDELCALIQHSAVISGDYSNTTNGEAIHLLFPTAETRADEDECCMKVHFPGAFNIENFDLVWWNDKYDGSDTE